MELNRKEIELIVAALTSFNHKLGATQYDDEWEKKRRLESISVLANRFEGVLRQGFLNGVAKFQVPDQVDVVKLVQVKAFSTVQEANSFIQTTPKIEVISIQPWLKNHGYQEYFLTYAFLKTVE